MRPSAPEHPLGGETCSTSWFWVHTSHAKKKHVARDGKGKYVDISGKREVRAPVDIAWWLPHERENTTKQAFSVDAIRPASRAGKFAMAPPRFTCNT